MPGWMVVVITVLLMVGWVAWISRTTMFARVRIWLDPQYRDGKHVARRSQGRHAAAGSQAADVPGLIVHRRPLHIRKLAPMTVRRYEEEWAAVETRFSEDPEGVVLQADRLITMVLLDRGFPVDDFERRAAELTARHGKVIANYHAAHAIALSIEHTTPRPDQLQRAMTCYQEAFDALIVGTVGVQRRRAG